MGYLITAIFAGATLLALYASKRCTGDAMKLALAALLLGIAGYAWQGHPGMAGNPVNHEQR